MLKTLRNKKLQKQIYILLTLMVLPPFLMWGINTSEKKSSSALSALGRIENRKISAAEYLSSYQAVQRQIDLMYGRKAKEIMPRVNLKGEAWDRILLLYHAKKENIHASDSEVVEWLTHQPLFLNKDRFDENFYKLYVNNYLHVNPRAFEEEIRQFLTIIKIRDKIKSGIVLGDDELKNLYNRQNAKRDLALGVLPWESQKDIAPIDDKEVEKIYALVKDNLKVKPSDKEPERTLTFAESKEELKKILLKEKASEAAVKKLEAVKEKMKTADFEKVLSDEKIDLKHADKFQAGDTLPGLGSPETLGQAIEAMKEGEISHPIKLSNAAVLVKVLKDWPADEKKFSEAKEDFRKKEIDKKTSEEMEKLLNTLRNKLSLNTEAMQKLFQTSEE